MPQEQPQPADNSEKQVLARLFRPESVRFAHQLRIPQFGIMHMLLWTTATAVLLKIYLALSPDSDLARASEARFLSMRILQIISAITMASGLVGSGALLRARCYAVPARLQPGHWIVLICTFGSIFSLMASLASLVLSGGTSKSIWASLVVTTCSTPLLAAAFGYATLRLRDARRWKIVLGALAFGHGVSAAGAIFGIAAIAVASASQASGDYSPEMEQLPLALSEGFLWCWSLLLLPLLILVAILDRHRWTSRDWVHWVGVVLLGLSYSGGIALSVLNAVIR